jgi:tripeptide aminopeptidase
MDTVQPGRGKKAVFHEDGKITSTGETVLGSDDLSGVVEILEGIRCVQEAGIPHRDIEVLFAIGEEAFLKGSAVFDYSRIKAEESYTLDMSGTIGSAALQAPTIISFKAVMHGKASHAGFEPEKGIHAIAIMSKAIAAISQGRLDDRTTLNIGTINGGEALNIVPEICTCTGEIRSYDHEKALACVASVKRIFEEKAAEGGATVDFTWVIDMNAYETPADSPVVRRFQQACQQLGLKAELTRTFGGSDNNHFVKNGLNGIVLSCGMYQVHSTEEYTLVEDMVTGAALVTALIDH